MLRLAIQLAWWHSRPFHDCRFRRITRASFTASFLARRASFNIGFYTSSARDKNSSPHVVHFAYHSKSRHRRNIQENSQERRKQHALRNLDIYFHGNASRNEYCYNLHIWNIFSLVFHNSHQQCKRNVHNCHTVLTVVAEKSWSNTYSHECPPRSSQILFRPQWLHSFTGGLSKGLKSWSDSFTTDSLQELNNFSWAFVAFKCGINWT
jgi:hypothetical protein